MGQYFLQGHPGWEWGGVAGRGPGLCLWGLVTFFVTPRAVAHQAPLFTEFSRQEYWSRLSFPSPGDLPPSRD